MQEPQEIGRAWRDERARREAQQLLRFLLDSGHPDGLLLIFGALQESEEPSRPHAERFENFRAAAEESPEVLEAAESLAGQDAAFGLEWTRLGKVVAKESEKIDDRRRETEDFLGPAGWSARTSRLEDLWEEWRSDHDYPEMALWDAVTSEDSQDALGRVEDAIQESFGGGFRAVASILKAAPEAAQESDFIESALGKLIKAWPRETLSRLENLRPSEFRDALDELTRGDFSEDTWTRIQRLVREL